MPQSQANIVELHTQDLRNPALLSLPHNMLHWKLLQWLFLL